MPKTSRNFAPRTTPGRVSVALGFGVLAAILVLFVLSDNITNGGSSMAPIWLRLTIIAGVLVIGVPAVVTGLRTRREDPSVLGTIAFTIACVMSAWLTITGVAGIFFE